MTLLEMLLIAALLGALVLWQRARGQVLASEARRTSLRQDLESLARDKREVEGSVERLKRESPAVETRARRAVFATVVELDDHVRRALEHLSPETPEDLRKGLELLARELEKTWERCGLTRIAPEPGTPFDPELHEALSVREDREAEAKVVDSLYAVGFADGEHLVRPARVAVVMPGT